MKKILIIHGWMNLTTLYDDIKEALSVDNKVDMFAMYGLDYNRNCITSILNNFILLLYLIHSRDLTMKINKLFYIILGEYDRIINTGAIKEYCKRYGVTMKQFENVSHIPIIECPALLESTIKDWVL